MADTRNASEKVFDMLLQGIVRGEYARGVRLPSENEMSAIYGVSRVTVRAALQRLLALNLVETRPGGGTYVKSGSTSTLNFQSILHELVLKPQDIFEMLEFRRGIEVLAAGYAAERATQEDILALEDLLADMGKSFESGDIGAYTSCDVGLHKMIAKISRNSLLERVVEIVSDIYMKQISVSNQWTGSAQGYAAHQKIVDAIRRRNPKAAAFYTEEHLDETKALLSHYLRTSAKPGAEQAPRP